MTTCKHEYVYVIEQEGLKDSPSLVVYAIIRSGRRHYTVRMRHETKRVYQAGQGVFTSLALATSEYERRLVATRKHLKAELMICEEELKSTSFNIMIYDRDGKASHRAVPREPPRKSPCHG